MSIQSQVDRLNAAKAELRAQLLSRGVVPAEDASLNELAALVAAIGGDTLIVECSVAGTVVKVADDAYAAAYDSVHKAVQAGALVVLKAKTADGYTFWLYLSIADLPQEQQGPMYTFTGSNGDDTFLNIYVLPQGEWEYQESRIGLLQVTSPATPGQFIKVYEVDEYGRPLTWEPVDAPEGGDGIPVPETAAVGQTVVVTAVDENDKPTEWEPVNTIVGLQDMEYLEPNQPVVPACDPVSGEFMGFWTSRAFIPADAAWAKNQVVYRTGEVDETWGTPIWAAGYAPVSEQPPEPGQTLIREPWHEGYDNNTVSWKAVAPILSVNGKRPDEHGAVSLGGTGDVVKPKELNNYVPKTYLRAAGMLRQTNGSELPFRLNGVNNKVVTGNNVTIIFDANQCAVIARKAQGGVWGSVELPMAGAWSDIVFYNGKFVCVSPYVYSIILSSDGLDWEEVGTGFSAKVVASNGEELLALDDFGNCWYATDPYNWTPAYFSAGTQFTAHSFVFGAGKYVAAPLLGSNVVYVSSGTYTDEDGYNRMIDWQPVELAWGIKSLIFSEGIFLALTDAAYLMTSIDGVNWTPASIVFDNGMVAPMDFVACGNNRIIVHSWENGSSYYGVAYLPDLLADRYGLVCYAIYAGLPSPADAVFFADGQFMWAAQDDELNPVIFYSDEALNWSGFVDAVRAPVLTINGQEPDSNGNVNVEGGGGSYSDWSEADKDAMAEYVIAKLPVYNGEVEDV